MEDLLPGLACAGVAALIQKRNNHIALLWASFLFAIAGGVLFARSNLVRGLTGAVGGLFDGLILGVLGAAALGVLIVDLLDRKPNEQAAFCAFVIPALYAEAFASMRSGGLATALTLGVLAAIFQYRCNGPYEAAVRWASAALSLGAGVAFKATGWADVMLGWADADLIGAIGVVPVCIAVFDLLDRKPEWPAVASLVVVPLMIVQTLTLIWGAFRAAIGG